MRARMIWKTGVLGLALLSMLGSTCTTTKVIEVVVGADVQAEFLAFGNINVLDETDQVDVAEDIDLAGILADNDIDPNDIVDPIRISTISYKITRPQGGRTIENASLTVERLGVSGPLVAVQGWNGSASAATDWIDITDTLFPDGVDLLNTYLNELLDAVKADPSGGTVPPNSIFEYHVTGQSSPPNETTDFDYRIRVTFQVQLPYEAEVLDF